MFVLFVQVLRNIREMKTIIICLFAIVGAVSRGCTRDRTRPFRRRKYAGCPLTLEKERWQNLVYQDFAT